MNLTLAAGGNSPLPKLYNNPDPPARKIRVCLILLLPKQDEKVSGYGLGTGGNCVCFGRAKHTSSAMALTGVIIALFADYG